MTRPYRPSNGSDGAAFENYYCYRCLHHSSEPGEACIIHLAALVYSLTDPEYPGEWIVDDTDTPRCTSYEVAP